MVVVVALPLRLSCLYHYLCTVRLTESHNASWMATNRRRWWWRRRKGLSVLWKWIILVLVKCVKRFSVHKARVRAHALFKYIYCRIVRGVCSKQLFVVSICYCCLKLKCEHEIHWTEISRFVSFRFALFFHRFQRDDAIRCVPSSEHHMFRWSVLTNVWTETVCMLCASAAIHFTFWAVIYITVVLPRSFGSV